jgi:hypothetical protein
VRPLVVDDAAKIVPMLRKTHQHAGAEGAAAVIDRL